MEVPAALSIEEIAQGLLRAGVGIAEATPNLARLAVAIYNELARGVPIPFARIGRLLTAAGVGADLASAVGARWLEFDPSGNVTGFGGLTLQPSDHRITIEGRNLHLWCPLDGFVVAQVLGRSVVVHTVCPATQTPITVAATEAAVERVEPQGAVMSVVVPQANEAGSTVDTRNSFYDVVDFYRSERAARDSMGGTGVFLLPMDGAFVLAGLLVLPLKRAWA